MIAHPNRIKRRLVAPRSYAVPVKAVTLKAATIAIHRAEVKRCLIKSTR
jgi:hypothetical protein